MLLKWIKKNLILDTNAISEYESLTLDNINNQFPIEENDNCK